MLRREGEEMLPQSSWGRAVPQFPLWDLSRASGLPISMIKEGLRRKVPMAEVVPAAPRETGITTLINCKYDYYTKNHRC